MAFTTGMQALQDAIAQAEQKAEAAKSGGSGKALTYINWKPGEKKILRFLTDDTITEDFYSFIIDKGGQTKNFMVDPSDPHRLQRYMSPVPGVGWRKRPNAPIEEPVTQKMSVCVAVLREEKPGEDGKLVIEDYLYDRVVNGITYPSRTFGIVQQSINNFWHTLGVSCFKRFGTICDRDYEITREGEGFATKYSIIPLPEVPELNSVEAVKQFYFYGWDWDDNDADRFLKCPQTVLEWANYFSSEDRYKHWLTADGATPTPAPTPSGLDEFAKDTTRNDEAQAAVMPPSGTKFSTLRETLLKPDKK